MLATKLQFESAGDPRSFVNKGALRCSRKAIDGGKYCVNHSMPYITELDYGDEITMIRLQPLDRG